MNNYVFLVIIAAIGGVAVALQGQFMGLMDKSIGTRESVFITYFSGGMLAALVMLADRGGNAISLRVDGQRTNLHRLWDSGIIARDPGPPDRYVASVMALADANAADWVEASPQEWAAESKRLRAFVYDFDSVPGPSYLDEAGRVLRRQLARAGVRLAATLNGIFCESGA